MKSAHYIIAAGCGVAMLLLVLTILPLRRILNLNPQATLFVIISLYVIPRELLTYASKQFRRRESSLKRPLTSSS